MTLRWEEKDEEVTPPENLVREHGVLDRLLLLYEAGSGSSRPRKMLIAPDHAAEIIRDFINNYLAGGGGDVRTSARGSERPREGVQGL
jgi:hypothetical protein